MTLTTKTRIVADYVSGIEQIDYEIGDIERDIRAGLWDWLFEALSHPEPLIVRVRRAGRTVAHVFNRISPRVPQTPETGPRTFPAA